MKALRGNESIAREKKKDTIKSEEIRSNQEEMTNNKMLNEKMSSNDKLTE